MKQLISLIGLGVALSLIPTPLCLAESVSNAVTVQGGRNDHCLTTQLPVNIWSLVAFDNAGQPCVTRASQTGDVDDSCDPDTVWDWQVQGHMVFTTATGHSKARVRIQLWAGNGGGSCYGGTANPIVCDNPATHYLQENAIYESDVPAVDLVAPFEFLFYLIPPYFSTPSDANYSGFWVFAMPIGGPAVCVSQNYWDLTHN